MYTSSTYTSETITVTSTPKAKKKIRVTGDSNDVPKAKKAPEAPVEAPKETVTPEPTTLEDEATENIVPTVETTVPEEVAVDENPQPVTPDVKPPSEVDVVTRAEYNRLEAEYFNYHKRVERDKDVAKADGVEKALMALLPILDDIVAARKFGDLVDGPFAAITRKLDERLVSLGLDRVHEDNVAFDPMVHEALTRIPSDEVAEDFVKEILFEGYTYNGKTLRAAQVIVSAGKN